MQALSFRMNARSDFRLAYRYVWTRWNPPTIKYPARSNQVTLIPAEW